MDVPMWHFQSDDGRTYCRTRNGFFLGQRHFFGKKMKTCVDLVFQVKNIIYFNFGYHQNVASDQGHDVKKCNEVVVFCDDVPWYFAVDDLGEYGCHGLKIKKSRSESNRELSLIGNIQNFEFYYACRRINLGNITHLFT